MDSARGSLRSPFSLRLALLGVVMLLLAGCGGPAKYLTVSAGVGLALFGTVSQVEVTEVQPVEIFEEESAVTDAETGIAAPKPTPAPSEESMASQSAEDAEMAEALTRLGESKWVMMEEGGVVAAGMVSEISISLVDGRISGTAGCNRFNAGYRMDSGQIQIAGISTTRMACEPDVMEREDAFLASLASVTAIQMDGADLILITPDGDLRFEARSAE
jgi:heat shock protein HslJ